jgi:hypothetical protein
MLTSSRYSATALAQPRAEIIKRARKLAEECRKIEIESEEIRNRAVASLEKMNASTLVDVHVRGDEIQTLSTSTLVYRALPAPEGSVSRFCDECLDTARRAMQKHKACMQSIHKEPIFKTMYLHWCVTEQTKRNLPQPCRLTRSRNLLLTPFAPFFVLFCYVIETSSSEDLKLLKEFCTTLETAQGTSETTEKLWRLCQLMCNVAALYVEAKSQQQEDQDMIPIGDEFDMYLSQLGLIPTEEQTAMALSDGIDDATSGNHQVAQMADWFSGSTNLMGLLEQDLSQIGGSGWSNDTL